MEIIKVRHAALQKALLTLESGLTIFDNDEIMDHELYGLMRDGVIQRFEYSIDTFWKFLKLYIEIKHGVVVEPPSPRAVLRTSLTTQLVTQEELDSLEDCVSDRNLTSHSYNEEVADKIYTHIPRYYQVMKAIVDRLT